MTKAETLNASRAELSKFAALANRWWGESARLRASGGRPRAGERPAMDGRTGAVHQGRFEATPGACA